MSQSNNQQQQFNMPSSAQQQSTTGSFHPSLNISDLTNLKPHAFNPLKQPSIEEIKNQFQFKTNFSESAKK